MRSTGVANLVVGLGALLAGAVAAAAEPALGMQGCCCVTQGIAYRCSEKSQADCLAAQPALATFPKMTDWREAWKKFVAASKAQEARPMSGGWIAESCADAINPMTGEPRGAPTGCCCFPADAAAKQPGACKGSLTEFDCRAECSLLRDGRLPSGCKWTAGACPP